VQCLSASAASCANPDLGDGQADEDQQNRGLGERSQQAGHHGHAVATQLAQDPHGCASSGEFGPRFEPPDAAPS
jgi:hypothetical protein